MRGFIDSIQTSQDNPDVAEVIWVRFHDDKIGQLLRYDNRHLLNQHKPNDRLAVPIIKQKKTFRLQGRTNWMRTQFPLTLCYATTAHKSQGQTLEEVIIDFSSKKATIQNGSFYTALTRVKRGSDFHLKDFKPEYIQANMEVEKRMKSMEIFSPHHFKKVYLDQKIFIHSAAEIKIGYININGLYSAESCSMLNSDFNLLHLDILLVADTRLSSFDKQSQLENNLSSWKVLLRADSNDNMKHMGMLLLVSKQSNINEDQVEMNSKQGVTDHQGKKMVYVQVIRIRVLQINVGFVYIRETPGADELKCLIEAFRNMDCIMGDLNLDPVRRSDKEKLQKLCGLDRVMILQEHTTTRSNQLDHIIMKSHFLKKVFATSFFNHSSDHRSISVRIPLNDNDFSDKFKKEWFFDEGKFDQRHNIVNQEVILTKFELNQIDAYLDILKGIRKDSVIFNLYVMEDIVQTQFEDLDPSLKSYHLLQAKFVIIPMKIRHIQGVVIMTVGEEIVFHFTELPSTQDLKDLLDIVILRYIQRLYESFSMEKPANLKSTITHTEDKVNPANNNQLWVYLLSYLKSKLFEQDIEKANFDFVKHERLMLTELKTKKVIQIALPKQVVRESKRKLKDQNKENSKPKKQKVMLRYFFNPDQETCWMNSCLQVVLTALDHFKPKIKNGSLLYNYLMYLQDSERTMPLDPTEIKNIIYLQEKRRIIEKGVSPIFRLFHFAETRSTNEANLLREVLEKQGQQDCRDFFECLLPNKEAWPDVVKLFQFSLEEFTKCISCGHISKSGSAQIETIMRFACPEHSTPLHEYISEKLNGSTFREVWRCEDGCNKRNGGIHCTRIVDVSQVMFFTTIIDRVQQPRDGKKIIRDTKCPVTEDVTITDSQGLSAVFSPIAVIHHTGIVTKGNDTRGHYMADVRNAVTDEWFRTSDDQVPIQVHSPSDKCYITIYKKITQAGTKGTLVTLKTKF